MAKTLTPARVVLMIPDILCRLSIFLLWLPCSRNWLTISWSDPGTALPNSLSMAGCGRGPYQ